MTQARRARGLERRRRGAWLLIAVPLVMILAGTLIFLAINRQGELGWLSIPGASTAPGASTSPDASTTPGASTTPASTTAGVATPSGQPDDSAAVAALKACRAKIEAGDQVLAAARTGMQHWSDHIQAQTDANAGKITTEEMEDIFDRTMKAGDEDEKQYRAAAKKHADQDGSCNKISGAPAEVTERLARCAERGRAQEPVLDAADDGMADWIRHLGEMRRSEQGKIHNPQQRWLATWRAAPKNINTYNEAADKFSAPKC
jgi:hypothetical protein